MPIDPVDLLRARLNALKTTLERASAKEKREHVGTPLVDNFNTILQEIETAFPDLRSSLPARIGRGHFGHLGVSDITYLDLEAFAEQALSLLQLIQRNG